MNLAAWIPRIQVIPLQDTVPCGFASGGAASVKSLYSNEKSEVILQKIQSAHGNGYGYVPNGPTFCLTRKEWEEYAQKTGAPSYETKDGVYVVFRSGTVPDEWRPWVHSGWYVPYEGEGIRQLKTGKAGELPDDFLPKIKPIAFDDFDHDIDWVVRKTFEAGKQGDKIRYGEILLTAGHEWKFLMEQAWKAGQNVQE